MAILVGAVTILVSHYGHPCGTYGNSYRSEWQFFWVTMVNLVGAAAVLVGSYAILVSAMAILVSAMAIFVGRYGNSCWS